MIVGQDRAVGAFLAAWKQGNLHHAWLLAGPRGVGKASFARLAATRVLAEAAGPPIAPDGLATPPDHPIAKLVEAGSHPDMRWLSRLERDRGEGLARNITVDQIRELAELIGSTPFLSPWRVVVIDSADDMEAPAANALLKMLEEPPSNSLFLLVSHSPGRLLATIRSRCRRLDFPPLASDVMASLLERLLPETTAQEREALAAASAGSVGRALAFAELDLLQAQRHAMLIMREGDPRNERRSSLAAEMGRKTAGDRYEAFLRLVPTIIAREARELSGPARQRALAAYSEARELAALAPRLSLDPAATVFQLGSLLASIAAQPVP